MTMVRDLKITHASALTIEERHERRQLRRAKQRAANIGRAKKMHEVRLKAATSEQATAIKLARSEYVGCSGWRYWKWRDSFYADVPQSNWFQHYSRVFNTVEINASFYSWPTVANVQAWKRHTSSESFVYTVKVCELITHVKRFKGTKRLIRDFGVIADVLGAQMGCFLFQLPPSHRYTRARLNAIVDQLDPARRNAVEFRHQSWWNKEVYAAFRKAGIIFCSCSGPRLPDELIRTADEVYLRLHGPERWYKHDYSGAELLKWTQRIAASGAKRAWIYFNNDYNAHAPTNAQGMLDLLAKHAGTNKVSPGRLQISL